MVISIKLAVDAGILPQRLPYGRCPSDGYQIDQPLCNYVGSLGPQCVDNWCGYDPFGSFCDKPEWGYTRSPRFASLGGHDPANVRGLFASGGAQMTMASVPDGLSNTLMLGEGLPQQHDHLSGVGPPNGYWAFFNGGNAAHCTTIIPINTQTPVQETCTSENAPLSKWNWTASWGFKSNHSGGANFALADGSIHFLSQNIDHKTYQLLGCRNDGQPVTLP
jgi:prepilin-type processing-associated H-X9-DG protein